MHFVWLMLAFFVPHSADRPIGTGAGGSTGHRHAPVPEEQAARCCSTLDWQFGPPRMHAFPLKCQRAWHAEGKNGLTLHASSSCCVATLFDDVRDHVSPVTVSNTMFHVDCVAGMGGGGTNGSNGMAMEAQRMFATLSPKLPPGRPMPTQILNTVQVTPNSDSWFRTVPYCRCLFWSCADLGRLAELGLPRLHS